MSNPAVLPPGLPDPLTTTLGAQREHSWLAVECGASGLLLPLADSGEISPYPGAVAVPHTKVWFLGVANLRGQLQGVVDLAGFLGLAATAVGAAGGWVVGFNARLEANCVLRVEKLSGLRRENDLMPIDGDSSASTSFLQPHFAGARFRETAAPARVWQEIRLAELAVDAHFLDILGRP